MRKLKPNIPLCMGLLLFMAINFARIYTDIRSILLLAIAIIAFALEIWGIILFARSPEMKNSKLRRWKLRLIGKEPK